MSLHTKTQTTALRSALRRASHIAITLGLVIGTSQALALDACGPLSNGYGPFDYRTHRAQLQVVEAHHFDAGVESLQRGKSSHLGGDLDYTLRASPNHARALMAMARLSEREKKAKPHGANYTIDCYFDRAVRFAPNDPTVLTLYAIHLNKKGKKTEAIAQLETAEKHVGRSPNIAYNMGLVYLDLNDFDNALKYAHIAYEGGFPLPGLRNMLKRAGKWREAEKQPAAAQDSPASTAPSSAGNDTK